MRMWDTRTPAPAIQFKVDTNFAITCDILSTGTDEYDCVLATGHRGFNGEGAEVKLWDMRNFSENSCRFINKAHQFTPETVRFMPKSNDSEESYIISASKDFTLQIMDMENNNVATDKHSESLACMDVLGWNPQKKT